MGSATSRRERRPNRGSQDNRQAQRVHEPGEAAPAAEEQQARKRGWPAPSSSPGYCLSARPDGGTVGPTSHTGIPSTTAQWAVDFRLCEPTTHPTERRHGRLAVPHEDRRGLGTLGYTAPKNNRPGQQNHRGPHLIPSHCHDQHTHGCPSRPSRLGALLRSGRRTPIIHTLRRTHPKHID